MSPASHVALLEDPFSSGGKVGSRFLNAHFQASQAAWNPVSGCELGRNILYVQQQANIRQYGVCTILSCEHTPLVSGQKKLIASGHEEKSVSGAPPLQHVK